MRKDVGLNIDPPANAIVLYLEEKRQIQALDRTQPELLLNKLRDGTMTHDYELHGTTTLFAAMNVLEKKKNGCYMHRHRLQKYISFLYVNEKQVSASKTIYAFVAITPSITFPMFDYG